ncbi:MAG: NAD+ synthase [Actinobacteria bacterium HGW-Actinobacteria-7]|jgi:NAD+ synthase (glutamine-hydrolysing)|nr:MAG: NAD+ synthase [Actinobacteria bacterium HGW-Actinobacteria-7]
MRVALAQINPTVGDIQGNMARVMRAVQAADDQGAGITILPELVLTGYPPEDLLLKEHFVEDNLMALEQVSAVCGHFTLVGFVDRVGENLYNAVALCGNNRVLQVYHKRRLPNYGVFDERRYFSEGVAPGLTELGGTMFATTICEDIWTPELAEEAVRAGATLLLNVSASPFHAGKGAEREDMLRARARDNGVWLAYCNLVGGQDELVFDGRSVVISPSGEVIARGKAFEEDLVIADFTPGAKLGASADLAPVVEGSHEVYSALVTGLGDYVRKNGFSDVAIGLSGGIDSALTAAIAADALGPEHVHGVLMPSRYSSGGSVEDSLELASLLGIETRELSVEPAFSALLETLAPSFEGTDSGVAEENLQARVRGTLLMALSNKFGWLTLATGNKSELSVGYSTLYGDMVGGYAPLKDVFKTRVYELAEWRNGRSEAAVIPQAIIDKAPSAELRPDQTDQDSLPPYDVLDAVLSRYVEGDDSRNDIVSTGFSADVVDRVIALTDRSEYKRRQGAPGIKITPKAFGKDRRMPITNQYGG